MADSFLICPMNGPCLNDLASLAEILEFPEKGFFLLSGHVSVFMVVPHTYDGLYAFPFESGNNAVDIGRMKLRYLSSFIAAHPMNGFELQRQQSLAYVWRMFFLLCSLDDCFLFRCKLCPLYVHAFHLFLGSLHEHYTLYFIIMEALTFRISMSCIKFGCLI